MPMLALSAKPIYPSVENRLNSGWKVSELATPFPAYVATISPPRTMVHSDDIMKVKSSGLPPA
jgi:hypothetical protein